MREPSEVSLSKDSDIGVRQRSDVRCVSHCAVFATLTARL